jgi:hypothetical protein
VDVYGHYAATRLLLEHDLRDATASGANEIHASEIRASEIRASEIRASETHTAVAVATAIRCHAGLDLITGMPVLIYLLPTPIQGLHETYSEHLPALLETGSRGETTYVVMASAPGYVQLRPTLTETRLHWFARSSARAILDAHIAGVSHGSFSPSHVFAQGDHLFVAGFGLPWADTASAYRAPEGAGEFPADVFAWARTVQHYGNGDPSNALPGDFGKLVGHCLHDDPRERPTAGELVMALDQVLSGASPWLPPARNQPEAPSESEIEPYSLEPQALAAEPEAIVVNMPIHLEEPLEVELESDDPEPVPSEAHNPILEPTVDPSMNNSGVTRSNLEAIITKELEPITTPILPERNGDLTRPALEIIEGDALPIDINALHPPHPLVEAVGLEADEPDVPIIVRGTTSEPIRIGFDADQNNIGPSKTAMRFSWAGVLAGLIGIGGLGLLVVWLLNAMTSDPNTRPNNATTKPVVTTPAPRTDAPTVSAPTASAPTSTNELLVNFKLEPENGKRGRLVVLEAPVGAALQSGDPLATVPGPVLFPVAGTYRLQVVLDGYNPAETVLKLPTSNSTVILRLQ